MLVKNTKSLLGLINAKSDNRRSDLFSYSGKQVEATHSCYWSAEKDSLSLPIYIVPESDDLATFFAALNAYYPSFAPITSLSYVVTREQFESAMESDRSQAHILPDNSLFLGLAIGEALSAVGMESGDATPAIYSTMRRTLGFAIARARFLYPTIRSDEVSGRWLHCRSILGKGANKASSEAAVYVASVLDNAYRGSVKSDALSDYLGGELSKLDFIRFLSRTYPQILELSGLFTEAFDRRKAAFDRIVAAVDENDRGGDLRAICLAFFCNEIAPGTLNHINIANRLAGRDADILLWYAVFAAKSEEFESGRIFAGACNKIIRDICGYFNSDARPDCDISVDELAVISRLPLKLSTLKPLHGRSLIVSLLPGVNTISRAFSEDVRSHDDSGDERAEMIFSLVRTAHDALSQARKLTGESPKRPRKSGR